MQPVNVRRLFVFGALLLLLANGASADGTYQRTKDRQTLVWNSDPKPSSVATWSGDRDSDEYATGYGTLTWYSVRKEFVTGSNIPSVKQTIFATYSGNMVRGKLDGPITAYAEGETSHATFVHGRKTSVWIAGPAPAADQKSNKLVADRAAAAQPEPPAAGPSPSSAPDKMRGGEATVEAPAEGPPPVSRQPAKQQAAKPAANQTPSRGMDDSLRSLISPPSLLRMGATDASPQASTPPAASSSPTDSRLTPAEVIDLASAEARAQGYDLRQYQNPQARYITADEKWSVSYEQKSADGMSKPLSVTVEDKTKKITIPAGK